MQMLIFGSILFLSVVIARPLTDAFYYTKTIDFLRRAAAASAVEAFFLFVWRLLTFSYARARVRKLEDGDKRRDERVRKMNEYFKTDQKKV